MSFPNAAWRAARSVLLLLPLLAVLLAPAASAQAAKLVGVVSERSAAMAAGGAHRYLDDHPNHEVVLRTPSQLSDLSDAEVAGLWAGADAVLMAGVFGDAAVRLKRLLRQSPPPKGAPVFIVSSTRSLVRQSRLDGERPLADLSGEAKAVIGADPGADEDPLAFMEEMAAEYPEQAEWLRGRAYWRGRGADNAANLVAWLLSKGGVEVSAAPPQPAAPLRYHRDGAVVAADELDLPEGEPAVAVLAYDDGDAAGKRRLLDALCEEVESRGPACFAVLARWGTASRQAVERLSKVSAPADLGAVISLQDFVVGGGEGREAVTGALKELDVPVLKGIRLADRTRGEWRMSADGLPQDSIHYRVGMPELQGVSQPLVLAAAEPAHTDPRTGLRFATTRPVEREVAAIAERAANWIRLRRTDNSDKRVGILYYNHPPGRHNIGADNLDVPRSLLRILRNMRDAGYETGELPGSPEALLERMQEQGVNLPENREELARLHSEVPTLSAEAYREWFAGLPDPIRAEMRDGPLGFLHETLREAEESGRLDLGRDLLERMHGDLRHLVEGADHPATARARDLLDQLRAEYESLLAEEPDASWEQAQRLVNGLRDTGIEGLHGWGEPPGRVMVHDGDMLIPGLRFGNVWIGPQPPRGWEVNEELLHANLAVPPPHQYLGYYHWLKSQFGADALVHLGRHSTYEFLPRRRVGLTDTDYPRLIAGDIPGVYPYIVDGVGEGLQAKRRGLTVMVDHLTPPLSTTPLYDQLLELRGLVESFESAEGQGNTPARERALDRIRDKIAELDMVSELESELRAERGNPELSLDEVGGDLLVHEVGHHLTEMQEEFMPRGLHIFGAEWANEERRMMLESMAGAGEIKDKWRKALADSPGREMDGLLAGLDGRFVAPGKGNDPVRTPEVLPTGRNFFGLNGNLLPSRVGWEMGAQMAADARKEGDNGPPQGSEAVVLWASDTVRDEGAMVAFGMDMLGIKPVWNSRGIVEGIERRPLEEGRYRRDVVFTTSGLFRDLYGNLNAWLDKSVRLALDGASQTIREKHPELTPALEAALKPLGELRDAGTESLKRNKVAAHWVADARRGVEEGAEPADAGNQAILRVYGDAPGSYGAGVNRMAERSGSWEKRDEVADTYLRRMGHAYGAGAAGEAAHGDFRRNLGRVERTYLGRASNLYGLLDNNDAFDYLGGLSMAVEQVTGAAPDSRIIDHSDPENPSMQTLEAALLQELRGRFLNPAWLRAQMDHGYSGARTMGSKFMEHLWGWQVTNPAVIDDWVWQEVKDVYLDDKHDLDLDEFLVEGNRAHVRTNMLAIMNVAIAKGFWEASQATQQELAEELARAVVENGLPGSGHTRPKHPVFDHVKGQIGDDLAEALDQKLKAAGGKQPEEQGQAVQTVAEVKQAPEAQSLERKDAGAAAPAATERATESGQARQVERSEGRQSDRESNKEARDGESQSRDRHVPWYLWATAGLALILLGGGFYRGLRSGGSNV
ncbi:cobalamin biosynthesis protein CobN [Thiohalorhabdus denitrificans]|uniref:Cobaltochelatase CobN n=1 Tax=Thiohalorhabdus denitrificans TaxID=381306 RepID=A0A0P9C792_9GAMM|nr:cobaltochelatase subunit CobN [Thiohalorhabdus denitrificans]KPV39076.1 cobalamin biosynthesis protein CobN [Thiohalorhabdus denitrificans]SCX78265.1 cobaltochelatase CobN [Thiohalorhabdus denitrificans]